jgi:predicted nucleotidyltransferase
MAMLSKLIEATGHQLTFNVEPVPGRRLGLPDTPLGRRLRRHRRAVTDLAERRGIRNIRVFGSVARGEDRDGSDIDLLVDVDDGVGLVAIAGLARELADLLGVPIDVVPADSLKRAVRADVLRYRNNFVILPVEPITGFGGEMADTTRLVGRAPEVACLEGEWQRAAGGGRWT